MEKTEPEAKSATTPASAAAAIPEKKPKSKKDNEGPCGLPSNCTVA